MAQTTRKAGVVLEAGAVPADAFDALYECIVSEQVSPEECMELLKDRAFCRYYCSRRHRTQPAVAILPLPPRLPDLFADTLAGAAG